MADDPVTFESSICRPGLIGAGTHQKTKLRPTVWETAVGYFGCGVKKLGMKVATLGRWDKPLKEAGSAELWEKLDRHPAGLLAEWAGT